MYNPAQTKLIESATYDEPRPAPAELAQFEHPIDPQATTVVDGTVKTIPILDLPDYARDDEKEEAPKKKKKARQEYDDSWWSAGALDARFECINEIGHGTFARVHMAHDTSTGGMVALKISKDKLEEMHKETKYCLQQEVAILKACTDCEFIVSFHGAWLAGDRVHIAMEYCPGGSISDIMEALDITLSGDQIALVCFDMLGALKFLHAKKGSKYIHRDIKAGNIVIDHLGHCKLADFGVSYIKLGTEDPASTIGRGSAFWMAPGMHTVYCPHA